VVPRYAGVLSALGLCLSDVAYDFSVSRVRDFERLDPATVESVFADLRDRGESRFDAEGIDRDSRQFDRTLSVRYAGQSSALTVPVPDGEVTADSLDTVTERFHDRHQRRYGHAERNAEVELVTVRLDARGLVETPTFEPDDTRGTRPADARRETRPVVFDGTTHETPV
jgi:N-methylhydantoinase A